MGFVAAGDFAGDHRRAQLTFCEVIGGIDAIVIQKGKEMIALFIEAIAHGFFVRFVAWRGYEVSGTVDTVGPGVEGLDKLPCRFPYLCWNLT